MITWCGPYRRVDAANEQEDQRKRDPFKTKREKEQKKGKERVRKCEKKRRAKKEDDVDVPVLMRTLVAVEDFCVRM